MQSSLPLAAPSLSPNPTSVDNFSSAHINNQGNFHTNVGTATYIYGTQYKRGRDMLREYVVNDALHTGKVRADPLECHHDTRRPILADLASWICDPRREKPVQWLLGPAGIGKSAIAKTTANQLEKKGSKARVAGSFFFYHGDPQRNNPQGLVLTLAYRLAIAIESIVQEIDEVIEKDPQILVADLGTQWVKLIVEPVSTVFETSASSIPPAVIILDDLDECGSTHDQRRVLDLIASCGPHFPIAFLITSRPERHIVNHFNAPPLSEMCRARIDLSAYRDHREMRHFVKSGFSTIYRNHRDILQCRTINGVWPSAKDIDTITRRADGQFIYPTTLFKFIDQDGSDPHERLQACLRQVPEALSPLDTLYIQIMHSSHDTGDEEVQDLLFLALENPLRRFGLRSHIPVSALEDILGVNPRLKLGRLHSVLAIPENDIFEGNASKEIITHHESFPGFLFDQQRSRSYYLDSDVCAVRLIERCVRKLEQDDRNSDFGLLVTCWWSCCIYLSQKNISLPKCLVHQLLSLDFNEVLRHIWYRHLDDVYHRFVDICRQQGSPELISQFDKHLLDFAKCAEWFRLHLVCLWQPCTKCPQFYSYDPVTSFIHSLHTGTCALSWKGQLALARAYTQSFFTRHGHDQVMKFRYLVADDFVGASLTVLTDPGLLRLLSESDFEYLKTWSRGWASCPKTPPNRIWLRSVYGDPAKMMAGAMIEAPHIVSLLRTLPKQYHFHELNRDNVVSWLKSNPEACAPRSELLTHWLGGECYSDCNTTGSKSVPEPSALSDSRQTWFARVFSKILGRNR